MKCALCKEKAVAHLRYFKQTLCKEHFCKLTEDRIRKTISKHKLFNKNDKVAVAVSGGKDSITLLTALHNFSQKFPIEIYGIIVNEGIKGYRDSSIKIAKQNFKNLRIQYKLVSFKEKFGKTLDEIANLSSKNACTYCGVLRRRVLNDTAKKLQADKLAVGHNLDDECQSAIMNYLRGDFARMARLGPKTSSKRGFVQRVKPLRDIPEKEIGLYAILQGYKIHIAECPYVHESLRADIRNHLNEFEEAHPGIKFSIVKGVDSLNKILQKQYKAGKLLECKKCGELSPAKLCKVCELIKEIT